MALTKVALIYILLVISTVCFSQEPSNQPFAATKITVSAPEDIKIKIISNLSKEIRNLPYASVVGEEYHWWIDIITLKESNKSTIFSYIIYRVNGNHQLIDIINKNSTPEIDKDILFTLKSVIQEENSLPKLHRIIRVENSNIPEFCKQLALEFHTNYIEPEIQAFQQFKNQSLK